MKCWSSSSFFLLFSLLFAQCFGDINLIQNVCKKASSSSPNIEFKFCVASFTSDPKSRSATTVEQLGETAFEHPISMVNTISPKISELLKDPKLSPKAKTALQDCSKLYSDATDQLKVALSSYNSKDYGKANVYASAAMDAASTCEDGFKELGETCPITQENHDYFELGAISLSFTCFGDINLIHNVCRRVPDVEFKFCVASFTSDPKSRSATTIEQLGQTAFEHPVCMINAISPKISKLLKDPKVSQKAKTALHDCSELYSNAIDQLKEALSSYNSKDYRTTNIRASAAMDAAVTCGDGFEDLGETCPLTQENHDYFELVAITLSFTV
ncbi:Pectinesterase inhibitor domain [Dillenia turbinata]|uniref:Pectinesterase inhibitor domain n=1 Tax=Dillenia turbinata TaxID=194707 RepID=A0AAN8VN97_9MAGN